MRHESRQLFLRLFLAVFLFFLSVGTSQAIPSFARKYNYVCTVCHTMPPKLNKFGLAFMMNGYQLNVRTESDDKLQKTAALSLLKDIPFSLRITADAHYSLDDDQPRTDLHFPEGVILYSAGSLTERISYWLSGEPFQAEPLDEVFIKFLIDYKNPALTIKLVKAGVLDMRDYYNFASGRNFTIDNYAIHDAKLGDINPFSFGAPQRAIELRGMFPGMTMWAIAVSNGPGTTPGQFDKNSEKDVYLRIHRLFAGQYALGGLAYRGTHELWTGRRSRFQRILLDFDVDQERFDLTGSILFGRDERLESLLPVSTVKHFGYFVEANYHLALKWHALARYDKLNSDDVARSDFPDLFAETLTLQINHFHKLNLRFIAEAVLDFSGRGDHIFRMGIDFDF